VTKCKDCGEAFDPRESMMGDEGQCQDCWEAECSESWWRMVSTLPGCYEQDVDNGRS